MQGLQEAPNEVHSQVLPADRAAAWQLNAGSDLDVLLHDTESPRLGSAASRLSRVFVLCVAAGALLATLFGLVIWLTASHAPTTGAVKLVRTYLGDLRDGRFTQAYSRLCLPDLSEQQFVAAEQAKRDQGQGVSSYAVHAGFTGDTTHLGSAGGVVTYADGSTATVRFDLESLDPSGAQGAVDDGGQCLLES